MFKITWFNKESEETTYTKREVDDIVNKIGADGAILIWTTPETGIINYYNSIIGVITETALPKVVDVKEQILKTTLKHFDKDDLMMILLKYDRHVQQTKKPDSLFEYVAFNFTEIKNKNLQWY